MQGWLELIGILLDISLRQCSGLPGIRHLSSSAPALVSARATTASGLIAAVIPGRGQGSGRSTRISARFGARHRAGQRPNILLVEFYEGAPLQSTWQHHGAVADSDETANRMPDRFEHATDLAVTPLGNGDPVPAIGALSPAGFDGAELSHTIIKRHAFEQAFFFLVVQRAQYAYGVFTFEPKARMHQLIGQLTRTRQKQQALSVQIKTSYRLPFTLEQLGQPPEHGRPILRIVMRHDLACRLVVGDNAGRWRINPHPNRLAIDLDGIAELDALPDVGGLGIDRNASFKNQLLHFQAGPQAGLRQYFVQFGGFGLRRQHSFRQIERHILFVSVKLAGHHVLKPDGGCRGRYRTSLNGRLRQQGACLFARCY